MANRRHRPSSTRTASLRLYWIYAGDKLMGGLLSDGPEGVSKEEHDNATSYAGPFADFQRAIAAFSAICLRFRGERLSALALPPFIPPIRPSATACEFFPTSGLSSGDPSSFSPIACTRL